MTLAEMLAELDVSIEEFARAGQAA